MGGGLFLAIPGYAQFSSNVRGGVTDPSGAVIPGAVVAMTNVATQVRIETTTDKGGNYAFPSLAPGEWRLSASASGSTTAQMLNSPSRCKYRRRCTNVTDEDARGTQNMRSQNPRIFMDGSPSNYCLRYFKISEPAYCGVVSENVDF